MSINVNLFISLEYCDLHNIRFCLPFILNSNSTLFSFICIVLLTMGIVTKQFYRNKSIQDIHFKCMTLSLMSMPELTVAGGREKLTETI